MSPIAAILEPKSVPAGARMPLDIFGRISVRINQTAGHSRRNLLLTGPQLSVRTLIRALQRPRPQPRRNIVGIGIGFSVIDTQRKRDGAAETAQVVEYTFTVEVLVTISPP